MNHVMIDIETMGTNPNAPIASIGAVFFNPKTGELGEKFYCRVDIETDMKNGAVADGSTIKWWLRQSAEARAELISDDALTPWGAAGKLSDWLTDNADDLKCLKVWANSPSFDCVILKSAFVRTDTEIPWCFWNEMDVRTIKEIGLNIMGYVSGTVSIGVRHNALDDAINQAQIVSSVISYLSQKHGGEL